uniref:G domain-containing protein n=1 Tax=Piliocolobus tephrosceles TaxID=591936 RepID=A0A8C9LYT5_9PRIM
MGILTLAKIVEIKAKMTWTQKNKATAHHLGLLKAHLGGGGGGPGEGFDVAKTGDAHTGFAGFPSVGKLTLLSNLAGVYSEVAACEFTTLTTAPGVIRHKGWSAVAGSQLTASSASWVYAILLPQPPG